MNVANMTREQLIRDNEKLLKANQELDKICTARALEITELRMQVGRISDGTAQIPTGQQVAALMVAHALVDSAAIDDPEGYDNFQTLEGINAIARELRLLNEKVRKG